MVSVSNVPLDGRVVRSATALAPIFDSVCVTGFTRGEEKPPQIPNLVFKLFLLKEPPKGFILAALARKLIRFRILFKIAWTVLSTKADVYYSHEAHLLPLAWLAARIRGAKIIYDIHEIYGEMGTAGITSYILKGFEAPFLRSCDVLITTNSDRARRISKVNHLPASRVEVIRNLPVINQSPKGSKTSSGMQTP